MYHQDRLLRPQSQVAERRRQDVQVRTHKQNVPQTSSDAVQTQARVVALQEELTDAERAKLDLSTRLHHLELKYENSQATMKDLKFQLGKKEHECESLQKNCREFQQELEEASSWRLQADILRQEVADVRAANARMRRQMDELDGQLIGARTSQREVEEELSRCHTDQRVLEQRLQHNSSGSEKIAAEKTAEIARLLATIEALNAELHVVKGFPMMGKSREGEAVAALRARIDFLESQLAAKGDTVRSASASSGGRSHAGRQDIDDRRTTSSAPRRPTTATPTQARPQAGMCAARPSSAKSSPMRRRSPLGRLEAALTGVTGPDESSHAFASRPPEMAPRVFTPSYTSSPLYDGDPLLQTYPPKGSAMEGPPSLLSPSPAQGGGPGRGGDPQTSTYPTDVSRRRPYTTADDLREELEAVKRETARLRRDLP